VSERYDKKPRRNTLLVKTLADVLPIALLGLFIILAVNHTVIENTLRKAAHHALRADAMRLAGSVRDRIGGLREAAESIAGNDLLVNAMIDVEGRNNCLPVFIRSLRLPGVFESSATLLDRRGRVIDHSGAAPVPLEGLFEQAMAGASSAIIRNDVLLLAVPVRVNGMVEGVLGFRVDKAGFRKLLHLGQRSGGLAILDGSGRTLLRYGPASAAGFREPGAGADPSWFSVRVAASDSPPLQLLVTKDPAGHLSFLRTVTYSNFLAFAFILLLLIGGIVVTALAATRPLTRFGKTLQAIRKAEDLKNRIEPTGVVEFRDLAVAFNEMIERLERTTTSRDRMTGILNALKEMLLVTDGRGIIEDANPAALAIVGCAREELLGRQITEIFLPKRGGESQTYLFVREAVESENAFEAYCIGHDGTRIPVTMSGARIHCNGGKELVVYTALDTTVLERTEATIANLRQRLETAIEAISEGFALYDQDERLVLHNSKLPLLLPNCAPVINKGAYYLDILKEGIERREFPEAVGQEERFLKSLRALHHEPTASLELRLGNGNWLQVMEGRTSDGGIVGLYRDITGPKLREERLKYKTEGLELANRELEQEIKRRKKAEQSLWESEARSNAFFDAAPDGIVTIDAQGAIECANPAMGQLFGCEPTFLKGSNIRGLVPELFELITKEQKNSGQREDISGRVHEMSAVNSKGRFLDVDVTMSSVTLGSQSLHLAILRDATERKKLQHLKYDLISTVSHELRTPMTSILGALELLDAGLAGNLPHKAAEMVSVGRRACERMVSLLNDILDLEKASLGKMQITFDKVPLGDLMAEVCLSMKSFAEKFDVELCTGEIPSDVMLHCDWNRTIQILTNLVSNAIKASPKGGRVDLEALQRADFVRFTVRDYGQGVPEEFAEKIFEPFRQLGDESFETRKGTGLGLAISQKLVHAQGGTIGFKSYPEEGSCFYFELPVALGAANQENPPDFQNSCA
jgi:PAS domain S-box-containing protein